MRLQEAESLHLRLKGDEDLIKSPPLSDRREEKGGPKVLLLDERSNLVKNKKNLRVKHKSRTSKTLVL